jgi:hypothetical protein
MIAFIEESRGSFGVEPICRTLQIAPSTYYDRRALAHDPDRASARAKSDASLIVKIDAAWEDNRKLYGARKIWHVLRREGEDVARCTVQRLMRVLGIRGVVRGKKIVTTNPDTSQPCPDDKVNRLFMADRPNKLWVSDFTYVPTWSGTVYVAFVIDVFARRIIGWRASTSMKTQFVLDALEQAIWQRKTPDNKSLVHHSDRGSQGGFNRSSQQATFWRLRCQQANENLNVQRGSNCARLGGHRSGNVRTCAGSGEPWLRAFPARMRP